MSGESAEGGPGSASRGLWIYVQKRKNEVIEEGLTRLGALCRMLRFYGVPRRISLGFAHSAAAAGYWRRKVVRSMRLLRNTQVFREFAGESNVGPASLLNNIYICDEIRIRRRDVSDNDVWISQNSRFQLKK